MLLTLGIVFSSQIATIETVFAADVNIAYWNGDTNCPIWVERSDGSKIVFKINSAYIKARDNFNGDTVIELKGYEIDSMGNSDEYNYSIFVWPNDEIRYEAYYNKTKRFPNGQHFFIENPYQIKICQMIEKYITKSRTENDYYTREVWMR